MERFKGMFCIPPEIAHWLVTQMIKTKALTCEITPYPESLSIRVMNNTLRTPVGLAAGFDKNADLITEMYKFGFGFVEVGTVTKKPQHGNPRPRIFRLPEDLAIINRLGFNNKGLKYVKKNINSRSLNDSFFGINIGCNADSSDRIGDYVSILEEVYGLTDYIALNISSPNTIGLRNLQHPEKLSELLTRIMQKRKEIDYASSVPIFVKISPDMTESELDATLEEIVNHNITGIIISNTTTKHREGLQSRNANQSGGLSGAPIFRLSTNLLALVYKKLKSAKKNLILIGVGGVFSGEDAYEKIKYGATLVQLYTAIVYRGVEVVNQINLELAELVKRDGFSSISQAIGSKID